MQNVNHREPVRLQEATLCGFHHPVIVWLAGLNLCFLCFIVMNKLIFTSVLLKTCLKPSFDLSKSAFLVGDRLQTNQRQKSLKNVADLLDLFLWGCDNKHFWSETCLQK